MADSPEPTQQQSPTPPADKPGGYGKRPIWQWILLYVIIGGLVYFAVYYFYFRGSTYNNNGTPATQNSPY